MRLQKRFGNLTIVAFILAFSALTQGQDAWSFPDFSATQVFESRKADMAMKIYHSGSSVRVERSGALSTLYVPSSSKVYNFTTYPDQSHQCVVMKPEQAKMLPSPLELLQGSNLKRTSAGTDVIISHVVISGRMGWDFQTNNGDGTSSTPRYKNKWFQLTVGFKI